MTDVPAGTYAGTISIPGEAKPRAVTITIGAPVVVPSPPPPKPVPSPPPVVGGAGILSSNDLSGSPPGGPLALSPMVAPSLLVPRVDPTYGTRVTRIAQGRTHLYSQLQAWSADETMILLYSEAEGATTPPLSRPRQRERA